MKTKYVSIALIAILFCTSAFMSSCNKNDWMDDLAPGSYIAVATLKKADGKVYLVEDDSVTLFPKNLQNVPDSLVDRRVWFKFYKYNKQNQQAGFNETVYLYEFSNYVLTKPYMVVDSKEVNDSIGNNPAIIQNAWITGKYLHIEHAYTGMGVKAHYINLVQNKYNGTGKTDKVYLEFRHNDRGESPARWYRGVSSFDISNLFPAQGGESVKINVSWMPKEGTQRDFNLELK